LSQNRILIIDANPVLRSRISSFLVAQGLAVYGAANYTEARALLRKARPDAAVLDGNLHDSDIAQLLQQAKKMAPRVPVLLLQDRWSPPLEVQALAHGASEVLPNPVELAELHAALSRLLASSAPLVESSGANGRPEVLDPFLGTSPAILRLREMAGRVLPGQSPILIQGETGAGKGVLAKWIHQSGARAGQPFLDLNCGGLSRELLESELFGHQKGAFTSADACKPGLLEVANGGTVFLDEIGDMDLQVQSKLLKVLEERVFRRLGDVRDRAVDIRLISATHCELLDLVHQQRFRSDLYFRVNIISLQVPPLRQRVQDIPALSEYLLRGLHGHGREGEMQLSNAAMRVLERYPWPGNIRELRNVLERAALVAQSSVLRPEHLHFQSVPLAGLFAAAPEGGTLKQMERAYINHVLYAEKGSIECTARRLGIPRSSLYNKMRRFQIPQGTGRPFAPLPIGGTGKPDSSEPTLGCALSS